MARFKVVLDRNRFQMHYLGLKCTKTLAHFPSPIPAFATIFLLPSSKPPKGQ